MTIVRDGEVVAFYLDDEVVCSSCAAAGGQQAGGGREDSLLAEELEGAIDELWCDRCGAGIFSFH